MVFITHNMKTRVRQALINLLKNEDKVVELQEIYWKIGDFYEITEFSRDLDKKHPSPRIQHEIRSQLNKLNKDGIIDKPGRAKYCINIDN